MALFVEKMGWEKRESAEEDIFCIVLVAERAQDIPKLTFATILDKRAMTLTEAAE